MSTTAEPAPSSAVSSSSSSAPDLPPLPPGSVGRADVLAHLHLLRPEDLGTLRMELVIPGPISSHSRYDYPGPGSEKFRFHKRGKEHVMTFTSLKEFYRVQERIVNRRPHFKLMARVAGIGPATAQAATASKPAPPAPAHATPAPAAEPEPVAPSVPPAPAARVPDEDGNRSARRDALNRMSEQYVRRLYGNTPPPHTVPQHNHKAEMVEAILEHEFGPAGNVDLNHGGHREHGGEAGVVVPSSSVSSSSSSSSSSSPVPPAEGATPSVQGEPPAPTAHTHASLMTMPMAQFKELAATLGINVVGKSRAALADLALSALNPAPVTA